MRLRFTSPVSMLDDQSSSGCTSTLLSVFLLSIHAMTLLTWRSRINLSYGDGSGNVWPAIEKRFFGTSSQVYTATMPGTLRAISVFTSSTIAFAYGLLRSFMTSASRGVMSFSNRVVIPSGAVEAVFISLICAHPATPFRYPLHRRLPQD